MSFVLPGWCTGWSGCLRQGVDPFPGGDDGIGPGPGRGDLEAPAAGAADEPGGGVEEEMGCPGYSAPAVANSQPAAVQQSYNGFVSEYTDSGHIHAAPWIQWKALWNACSYTHACGTGIGNVAGFEASTTYTAHRNQQIAEPKAPLWEVLLAPYVAAGIAAAGPEVAGPAYDAAYALSVRVSAWWLTLGAAAGAAKVGQADTSMEWGEEEFERTEKINYYLSESQDASDRANQIFAGIRNEIANAQTLTTHMAQQAPPDGAVNDPVGLAITGIFAVGTMAVQSGMSRQ